MGPYLKYSLKEIYRYPLNLRQMSICNIQYFDHISLVLCGDFIWDCIKSLSHMYFMPPVS